MVMSRLTANVDMCPVNELIIILNLFYGFWKWKYTTHPTHRKFDTGLCCNYVTQLFRVI